MIELKRLLPIILTCFLLASCSHSAPPDSISAAQPLQEPQIEELVEPQIVGPPEFQEDIKNALALLKEKAPDHYEKVCKNVVSINLVDDGPSNAWVGSVIIYISKKKLDSFSSDKYYLPVTLVHETVHVIQFRNGALLGSEQTEREALAAERDALQKLGAPPDYIERVAGEHLLETRWWEN